MKKNLLYIKLSEIAHLTYDQKNRDVTLNRAKEYYENYKERLSVQTRDQHKNLSEEEKIKKRQYGKNRYRNMSDEKKKKIKRISKKLSRDKKVSI